MHQEELGDIHWSWLNVGVTGILESISSLIEWCHSKLNMLDNDSVMAKTVNGFKTRLERERQRRWVCFWTDVRWASGPWRSSGAAVLQVSYGGPRWNRGVVPVTGSRVPICRLSVKYLMQLSLWKFCFFLIIYSFKRCCILMEDYFSIILWTVTCFDWKSTSVFEVVTLFGSATVSFSDPPRARTHSIIIHWCMIH